MRRNEEITRASRFENGYESPISVTVPLQLNHSKPPPLAVVLPSLCHVPLPTPQSSPFDLSLSNHHSFSSLVLATCFSPSCEASLPLIFLPRPSLFLNLNLPMLFVLSASSLLYLRLSLLSGQIKHFVHRDRYYDTRSSKISKMQQLPLIIKPSKLARIQRELSSSNKDYVRLFFCNVAFTCISAPHLFQR